jgi:UDP-2,3-diacylglucosamine pyrophosphatase LpxH
MSGGPERVEYVLLSDVHLTEIAEPPEPGWWEYKAPSVSQDAALAGLLEALEARRPAGLEHTELVFNGDTFDFDSVFRTPAQAPRNPEGLASTLSGSVHKLVELLGDHPGFVSGLARFLAAGNRAAVVMGNHDRELAFPEVREVLRMALARAAPPGHGSQVAGAVRFEPWFVYVPGVFYAEHGQQYDSTCAYSDVLDPILPPPEGQPDQEPELEVSFGSVVARKTLGRMGTFNPFNDESFLLSLGGYFRHFFRHYFPRHRLFRPYFWAIGSIVREVLRLDRRVRAKPDPGGERYQAYARTQGVGDDFIAMLRRLGSEPLHRRKRAMFHELWVDRWGILAGLFSLGVLAATTVQSLAEAALLLLFLPLTVVTLRLMGRGSLALQERGRWGLVAEEIADRLGVPVVAFGHSHRPERRPLSLGRGRYYNLGSWAPVLPHEHGTTLARARRYLVLRPGRDGAVHAAFERWET